MRGGRLDWSWASGLGLSSLCNALEGGAADYAQLYLTDWLHFTFERSD
jgi:hypothetical protein